MVAYFKLQFRVLPPRQPPPHNWMDKQVCVDLRSWGEPDLILDYKNTTKEI
jgi:hypothetical protein